MLLNETVARFSASRKMSPARLRFNSEYLWGRAYPHSEPAILVLVSWSSPMDSSCFLEAIRKIATQ